MQTTTVQYDACIKRYFGSLAHYPVLTPEEEYELACRKGEGNRQALDKLIKSNLRLVVRIAKSYTFLEPSLIDLIQEGNIGLIRAAEKFDHSLGCRFSTYASYWIKHYITRFIAKRSRAIRVPIRKSDMFRKILKLREEYIHEKGCEPSEKDLAMMLGTSPRVVADLLEICQSTVSLEGSMNEQDYNLYEVVCDTKYESPESVYCQDEMCNELHKALESLVDSERHILASRYGLNNQAPRTLKEVGAGLGISAETVRQIENRAIGKIRRSHDYLCEYVD